MLSLFIFLVGCLNIPFALTGENKYLNLVSWAACGFAWYVAWVIF